MGRSMTDSATSAIEQKGTCFLPRKRIVLPVATVAFFDLPMDPFKDSASLLMIEIFGIKNNDGFIRSLVFGVTDNAILPFIPMIAPIL